MSAAFQDISSNPANMAKYQDNPKVQKLIKKLGSKFGGGMAGGMPGGMPGGFPGGMPFGGASDFSNDPPKAPEQPDID